MFTLEYFLDAKGVDLVADWLDNMKDRQVISRITARIRRLQGGVLGDCKPLRDGLWELRLSFGPGYRIYYSLVGKRIILLLCGGDKSSQDADIERALAYLQEYKRSQI